MIVLSSRMCSSARVTLSRLKIWELAVSKRLSLSVQRCCSSEIISTGDNLSSAADKYRNLQKYFVRRLKATYQSFSKTPDHSVVYGHHHVYFIKDNSIYRVDQRDGELDPENVVSLKQISRKEGESRLENEESFRWTIQRIRLSPQEKHLATTLKSSHKEEQIKCVVVRLGKKSSPHRTILEVEGVLSFEWATDDVMFYTTLEGLRSSSVFRLDLTSDGSRIAPVYEQTQPDVFVEVSLSRDQQILTINCSSRTSSEVLLTDVTATHLEPLVVQPRQQDLLYHVEHWRKSLIILTNTGPGQEYQVVRAPLSDPSLRSWVSLFVPDPDTMIKDMDVVGDHCVLVVKTPSNQFSLIVIPLTHPKEPYTVQLPPWACAVESKKPGLAVQQDVLDFLLSSPVHPPVPHVLYPKEGLLLSGSGNDSYPDNQAKYITTHLEACSQDGTLVPVTLFHAVAVEDLSQVPLLIHVYGAYGRDLNMDFHPMKSLLLDQGWVLAYCHIRGGGERGLSWQRQARVEGKERGVEDLQACLHHLCSLGISSPSRTALTASSAGAVPVGALCNRNPNMMRAITLQAPFLDVLGSMEDPSLPLTLEDREEWGDPVGNVKHRCIIASYCPLHNITPQHYPSMLLTAYTGDPRVPLGGVLRYAQRLQKATQTYFSMNPETDCKEKPNMVLNIHPGGNHLGPEDFEQMLEEEALELAFLHTELGLDPPKPRRRRRK
uniref:Prolyl endopeptidase n=2 Tax=Iconisemion striatum TaxID=60296 RepID=A0A1A7XAG4_9TELE